MQKENVWICGVALGLMVGGLTLWSSLQTAEPVGIDATIESYEQRIDIAEKVIARDKIVEQLNSSEVSEEMRIRLFAKIHEVAQLRTKAIELRLKRLKDTLAEGGK